MKRVTTDPEYVIDILQYESITCGVDIREGFSMCPFGQSDISLNLKSGMCGIKIIVKRESQVGRRAKLSILMLISDASLVR